MKKIFKKPMKTIFLVVLICSLLLTGCGKDEPVEDLRPVVNLNDYVEITGDGYDGYGTIYASFNYNKLIEDYADSLAETVNTQHFGERTPAQAAEYTFSFYKPYTLIYSAPNNISNGDFVDFTWETGTSGIEILAEVLDLNYTYENFSHSVKELDSLTEIDPLRDVKINCYGISGEGIVDPSNAYAYIDVHDVDSGSYEIGLIVDNEARDNWSNGDLIHVSLNDDDYDAEYIAENHGIIFSRTEGEVVIDTFPYYAYDDPEEVLTYLSDESFERAEKAIAEWLYVDNENRTFELVGCLYYYQNEGHELTNVYNTHNQLVFIYHITNDKVPGGWYTYIAPNSNVVVGYDTAEDGSLFKTTMLDSEQMLSNTYLYYDTECYNTYQNYEYPITFMHEDVLYVGHQTIEDCIAAYETNSLGNRVYDNIIANGDLQVYVQTTKQSLN